MRVLILGSGPNALEAQNWAQMPFDALVAINNAWRVRPDWTHSIYPEDFPASRRPAKDDRPHIDASAFVPAQNAFGGFIYAGGTMAFTAAYWALHALAPSQMAFLGCDMVYAPTGNTHFYGTGAPDPLRDDPTLQSLEAKSARLMVMADRAGCACTNLSRDKSRLVFPRGAPDSPAPPATYDRMAAQAALQQEARLGYMVASGRYWDAPEQFDPAKLRALDDMWLNTLHDAG